METTKGSLVTLWNGQNGVVLSVVADKANVRLDGGKRQFVSFSDITSSVPTYTEGEARFKQAQDRLAQYKQAATKVLAPGKVDESKWEDAKNAVKDSSGKNISDFSDKEWATVNTVYQNMGGQFKSKAAKTAEYPGGSRFITVVGPIERPNLEPDDPMFDLVGKTGTLEYYLTDDLWRVNVGGKSYLLHEDEFEPRAAVDKTSATTQTREDIQRVLEAATQDGDFVQLQILGDTHIYVGVPEKQDDSGVIYAVYADNESKVNDAEPISPEFTLDDVARVMAKITNVGNKKTAAHPNDFQTKYPVGTILVPQDTKQAPELEMIVVKGVDEEKQVYVLERRPVLDLDLDKQEPAQAYGVRYEMSIKKLDGDKDLRVYAGLNVTAGCPGDLLAVERQGQHIKLSFKDVDAVYTTDGQFVYATEKTAGFSKVNDQPLSSDDAQALIDRLKTRGIETATAPLSPNSINVYADDTKIQEAQQALTASKKIAAELGTLDNNTVPVDRAPTKSLVSVPNSPADEGNILTLEEGHPAESDKKGRAEGRAVVSKKVVADEPDMRAETIRDQIGNVALSMLGAKNLSKGKDAQGNPYFSFKIGRNAKRVSWIRITLMPDDTYTMEFLDAQGQTKDQADGVYVDQLNPVIEEHTGLYTSLGSRQLISEAYQQEFGRLIKANGFDRLQQALAHKVTAMGQTRKIHYVIDVNNFQVYPTSTIDPMAWDVKQSGRPTPENIKKFVEVFNASLEPGGANSHVGRRGAIYGGVVTDQFEHEVVAEWSDEAIKQQYQDKPMFEVVESLNRLSSKIQVLAAAKAIELKEIPGDMLERQKKYQVLFRGQPWGNLYYNMTGYVAERGLPAPNAQDAADQQVYSLQIGERALSAYKSEISRLNKEWAAREVVNKPAITETPVVSRLSGKIEQLAATELSKGYTMEGAPSTEIFSPVPPTKADEDTALRASLSRTARIKVASLKKKAERLGNYDFDVHGGSRWKLEAGEDGQKRIIKVKGE